MAKLVQPIPCLWIASISNAARSGERPVTISARPPISFAQGATSRTTPDPNRMRVAVANSKRIAASPALIRRKDVGVFYARAGLRHHGGHFIAPSGVMPGLLVTGRAFESAINLGQQEAARVIGLLHHVKPGN